MNTWQSSDYIEHAAFVPKLGAAVLELLDAKTGERILDVGCGEGTLTAEIAAHGATVVGIDNSSDMVGAARARGLDARLLDAEALGFEHEFDAVFSNAVLHWIRNQEALLSGVSRALRDGGRFVAELGGHGNVAAIEVAIRCVLAARSLPPRTPRFYPTADEYRARLEAHGFAVSEIALIPRPTPLPTGIRGWLDIFERSTLERVGAARDEVVRDIEEVLRPSLCDGRGRWTADYVRLRFRAVKPLTRP
jgi:SAM-dependent methyltransferase